MEKIYPIDILGTKSIGIEKWMKNYFAPVTGIEYQDIYENILCSYIATLKKYDNDIVYWLAISNISLTIFISNHIFNLLRLSRLEKEGYEYVIGRGKKSIAEAFSTFSSLANFKLVDSNVFELGFSEKIKLFLKIQKYNLPNVINNNFLTNISHPYFLIGSRTRKEIAAYCDENKISPIQIFPLLFARNGLKKFDSIAQPSEIIEFVYEFLSQIRKQYSIIENIAFRRLENDIKESFLYSLIFFHNIVAFVKRFKYKTLLVENFGTSIHRLFCAAVRYTGGEVIGFVHGNAYCTAYKPGGISDGSLSVLNQYIASSYGEERIIKHAIKDFPLGLKVSVNVTHSKHNSYYPLFKKLQKDEPAKEISKVMLIGFPMTNLMYTWYPEFNSLSHLHLELRLVKLLKAAGYHVIYKAHPDRLREVEGIFTGYADKVLTIERFEDVYNMANCLLFTHAYSTTFGFSLLTRKPMVLIKTEGETWFPRAFELLKKRCFVVDADPDDSGRLLFEDQDLVNAVRASLNNIDYAVLHEFAF